MRKGDMIDKFAEEFGMTKVQAEKIINLYGDIVAEELCKDGESVVHGVGNFKVKVRAARTARNPQTGETIAVPEKKAVTFKATSTLKAKVQ
jgi:DNA-binding protein HU-beta